MFRANRAFDPPFPLDNVRRVVDLGAGDGKVAGEWLARYPDATAISFEADPVMFARLARRARKNDRWQIESTAAWYRDESLPLIRNGHHARIGIGNNALTVRGVDVFPFLHECDLLKITVAGAEWQLLSDHRFAGIDVGHIVLKWHPRGFARPNEQHIRELLDKARMRVRASEANIIWATR